VQFISPSHGLCSICTWTPLFWTVLFGANYEPTHRRPCSHGNSSIERWKVLITQISVVTHRNNFSSPGVWMLPVTVRVYSRRDVTGGTTLRAGSYILFFQSKYSSKSELESHVCGSQRRLFLRVWPFLVTFGPQYLYSALKDVADVDTDMRRWTRNASLGDFVVVRTS